MIAWIRRGGENMSHASLVAKLVKNLPAMQEIQSLVGEIKSHMLYGVAQKPKQESEHVVPFSQLSNDITFKVKIQVIQIVKCPHDFLLIFYHSVYYYFAPLSSYISSVLSSISGTLVNMR